MPRPLAVAFALLLGAGCAYETHGAGSSRERQVSGDGGVPSLAEDGPVEEGDGDPEGDERPGDGEAGPHHPDPAVRVAVEAWRWRSGAVGDVPSPDTRACARRIGDLEVVVPSHREFRRLCHRCDLTDESPHCESLGRVNACAPFGGLRGDDGYVGDRHALVVLDATRAADRLQRDRLVIHETIHHLGECTDAGADSPHENATWWCVDQPSCINGRARASLGR